jgi:putative flavoprotein involved in K+ transport
MSRASRRPRLDVIVIGAGQAGLAMGRELERAGRDFLLIDGARRIGDAWRSRWDSLRLFTPAIHSSLRGIPFPAAPDHLPTKDEVAGYLAGYAHAFSMPVALDEPVRDLLAAGAHDLIVTTDYARYRARHVVVATGGFQAPSIPVFASLLPAAVTQLHSSEFRNERSLPPGPVMVVGAGNSGVQIAAELAVTRDVTLATGRHLTRLPARVLGRSVFHWLQRTGAMDVTVDSFLGRRASRAETLIGQAPRDLAREYGVRIVPRIHRVEAAGLRSIDGTLVRPSTVVWATGFKPSYPWLRAPVFDRAGRPRHVRGITDVPGLAFLGLPWQHTRGSALLGWVARDAEYLASRIDAIGRTAMGVRHTAGSHAGADS